MWYTHSFFWQYIAIVMSAQSPWCTCSVLIYFSLTRPSSWVRNKNWDIDIVRVSCHFNFSRHNFTNVTAPHIWLEMQNSRNILDRCENKTVQHFIIIKLCNGINKFIMIQGNVWWRGGHCKANVEKVEERDTKKENAIRYRLQKVNETVEK